MAAEQAGPGRPGGGALEGLRVVDLSQVWAGPLALKLLGDMGADVIKVESGRRTDTARGDPNPQASSAIYPDDDPGDEPWNRAGLFNDRNRSKRGICLDLTMPEGIATLKRVIAASDVVAESYRFGVLERLGAGYEAIREVKPDIVYVSFSSQGATGPERSYGSYGAILEQTAGIASITGYRDGPPKTSGTFFPDPVVAVLGVGTILAAVRRRDLGADFLNRLQILIRHHRGSLSLAALRGPVLRHDLGVGLFVRVGDDVNADQFAHSPGCGRTRVRRRFDRADIATARHGDEPGTDVLLAFEHHLRGLDHRVSGLDSSHKALRLNHSQSFHRLAPCLSA